MPFTDSLLAWHAQHHRDLPWKNTQDPYAIWLSEIILQQTRVAQGLPYYERFLAAFPSVRHLADASADEVMRLWEGLGYYSRARHLHQTAQYIAYELGGNFPHTYETIRQLKGVGDYTAAAIASFAFGLPYAVIDGNVYRVLARVFGIDTPTDTTAGKQQFAQLAQSLLPRHRPADFNQAMMDFGASCCTPTQPDCPHCPLSGECRAYAQGMTVQLPVKSKKTIRNERYFTYLVLRLPPNNAVWIVQRTQKDIWQNLYEFPMIASEEPLPNIAQLQAQPLWQQWLGSAVVSVVGLSAIYTQLLTHRTVKAQFCEITIHEYSTARLPSGKAVAWEDLDQYAFPKIIKQYRQDRHKNMVQSKLF